MDTNNPAPILHLFRIRPDGLTSRPPLCSSMQSLDSCLLLLSLERYPEALITCASAIESVIKAHFGVRPGDHDKLHELIERARNESYALRQFRASDLNDFRKARNRMIHYGFTSGDNQKAATFLLGTGIPFLNQCYKAFFNFDFDEGLFVEYSESLNNALGAYSEVKTRQDIDFTECFIVLKRLIRWRFKHNFMTSWELDAAQADEENGMKYSKCADRKSKIETSAGCFWLFDCPVCDDFDTLVCQLDEDALGQKEVNIMRADCVSCGLVIPESIYSLARITCQKQLKGKKSIILNEYGLFDFNDLI